MAWVRKSVHVVTRFPALAPALAETLELPLVYRRLFTKGLTFTANHWVRSIDGDRVRLYHFSTGEETVLSGFESIVLATGHRANDALYFALRGRVPVLCRIGDCLAPGKSTRPSTRASSPDARSSRAPTATSIPGSSSGGTR